MAKAQKARQLPFVVQPRLKPIKERLGTDVSGQIEIERRGYLTVAEKAWVQALEADDGTQGKLHRLAVKVGGELNMDPREALTLISESQMADPRLAPFHEELMAVLGEMQAFQERRRLVAATCLLVNRVDPAWQVEDTLALHDDLIEDLNALYVDEEAKSIAALEAAIAGDGEEDKPEEGKE